MASNVSILVHTFLLPRRVISWREEESSLILFSSDRTKFVDNPSNTRVWDGNTLWITSHNLYYRKSPAELLRVVPFHYSWLFLFTSWLPLPSDELRAIALPWRRISQHLLEHCYDAAAVVVELPGRLFHEVCKEHAHDHDLRRFETSKITQIIRNSVDYLKVYL